MTAADDLRRRRNRSGNSPTKLPRGSGRNSSRNKGWPPPAPPIAVVLAILVCAAVLATVYYKLHNDGVHQRMDRVLKSLIVQENSAIVTEETRYYFAVLLRQVEKTSRHCLIWLSEEVQVRKRDKRQEKRKRRKEKLWRAKRRFKKGWENTERKEQESREKQTKTERAREQ